MQRLFCAVAGALLVAMLLLSSLSTASSFNNVYGTLRIAAWDHGGTDGQSLWVAAWDHGGTDGQSLWVAEWDHGGTDQA